MTLIVQVKREGEWRKLTTINEADEKKDRDQAVRSISAWAGYFDDPLRAVEPERYGRPLNVVIGARA